MEANELLVKILQNGDARRTRTYEAAMARLSPREQRLVREAAVLGYVQGAYFGKYRDSIPPDSQILVEVLVDAAAMSDLYPALSGADTDLDDAPWCSHPDCHDRVHGDPVHTDENGRPFHA